MHSQAAQLQQPLDSGSDDSDFVSTSESEDEEMAAAEPDEEVRSQDGEADMEVAATSGEGRGTKACIQRGIDSNGTELQCCSCRQAPASIKLISRTSS